MANRGRNQPPKFVKGDLVKQKALGGHVMTVVEVSNDGQAVIGAYITPNGIRHEEGWPTDQLKHVPL